eukprot:7260832-Alexandrium_andersonii.AAC.1
MSASLVGSEMCIRDRCSPGWFEPHICIRWNLRGASAVLPGSSGAASVSYTDRTLPTICSV